MPNHCSCSVYLLSTPVACRDNCKQHATLPNCYLANCKKIRQKRQILPFGLRQKMLAPAMRLRKKCAVNEHFIKNSRVYDATTFSLLAAATVQIAR